VVLQVKPEEIKKLNETPSELFFSSLTVPATKRNYIASLKKILCEFLGQVLKGDPELINQQIAEYKKQKLENKKPYWDADFEVRINEFVRRAKADPDWEYLKFSRKNWETITKKEDRRYLKNSFRVLLTRARQGLIIFVPKGDRNDNTFLPEFYDGIYNHLKEIGLQEI
jgi:hypothetical protein